ncbi:MAG: glutamine cyclotransferase [Myxococcales bacterium]|nr:glutamine cyclotransferase [Myxococcales bacterium]
MQQESQEAEIVGELEGTPNFPRVNGVMFDGELVWAATGSTLFGMDPKSGQTKRTLDAACDAGTAFDGKYIYQLAEDRIDKIDAETGKLVVSLPAPGSGTDSGMAWAEGSLWIGRFNERKIQQVDPETGEVLRTIESDRFVTGVSWVDGELWHATWEDEQSEIRNIDPTSGQVKRSLKMPHGTIVSGLDADGDHFYCGGGTSGKVRVVARPGREDG